MKTFSSIILTILIFSILSNSSVDMTSSSNIVDYQYGIDVVDSRVVFDGQITPGEYEGKFLINSGNQFYLHYAINNQVIYLALEGDIKGYMAIGFGSGMAGADIYIGYVDGSGGHMSDNFGNGGISHKQDNIDNILNVAGSENTTSSVLEFSRNIDTGDSAEDAVILLNSAMNIIWAYSDTADDFFSAHTARGYSSVTFTTTAPSKPFNLNGVSGNTEISLTWESSVDGGSAISEYRIYTSSTMGGPYSLATTTSLTSHTLTGLINSQIYYIVVSAVNNIGESSLSNEIGVTPTGIVSPPGNLVIAESSSQVIVNWTVPTSDGGSPVIGYKIYRSLVSGDNFTYIGENDTALGYTDTTVTNGLTYYYYVVAYNIFVSSLPSVEIAAHPVGESEPPRFLVSTLSISDTILLNWSSPISDGGFSISNYYVYRADSSGGPYTYVGKNDTSHGFEDISVVSLATYYYIVKAENSYGNSSFSEELKVKVARVPYKSSSLQISTGFIFVDLNWTEPFDNGYPITYYSIYRSTSEINGYLLLTNTSMTEYRDSAVSNRQIYYYKITATNSQGESPFSNIVSIVAGGLPEVPLNTFALALDKSIQLNWTEPIIDGGFSIKFYNIYRSNFQNNDFVVLANTSNNYYVDTQVENGIVYYYKISATNSKGEGKLSEVISAKPGRPPSIPINLKGDFDGMTIGLNWSQPVETSNYSIFGYFVYRSSGGGDNYRYLDTTTNPNYTDTSFIIGIKYSYVIQAITLRGYSNFSSSIDVVASTIPFKPINLSGSSLGQNISLSWQQPIFDGGSPITYYKIYYKVNEGDLLELSNSTSETFVHNNLTYGNDYTYFVTSVNERGESELSNNITITLSNPFVNTNEGSNGNRNSFDFNEILITSGMFIGVGVIIVSTYLTLKLPKPQLE